MGLAPPGPAPVKSRRAKRTAWRPALLREPDRLLDARATWAPSLIKTPSTVTVLMVFLALQFLIPARLVIGGMGAVGRPSVAVGILLMFLWIFSAFRSGQLPKGSQPLRWIIGAFLAVQLFSYAVGYDRGLPGVEASAADRWLIFIVAMGGVALATADGVPTRKHLDRLLLAMVGLTTVMAVIGILQFLKIADLTQFLRLPGLHYNAHLIGVGERGGPGFARAASTASHYIEFGVVLSMVMPLAVHFALFSKPGRQRRLRWTMVGLIGAAIPFSLSRSATLTIALAMLLMTVVWPWRQRYNAAVVGVVSTLAFSVIQPGVLGTIRSLFANTENDPSIQNRISDTAYVMEMWSERPWFGRGAGTFIPERYILLDNQLYGTLLSGGVVGLAGLVALFVALYFAGRSIRLRGFDQETRHLGHSLAVVMPVSLLASATFDSFGFPTFVGVLFIVAGAIGALWRLDGGGASHRPLQPAAFGDKFVNTPLMTYWKGRAPAPIVSSRARTTTP